MPKSKHGPAAGKVLDDALLADVFGIEMAEAASPTIPATPRRNSTATAKTEATTKTVADQQPVKANVPVKASAGPRKSTARNGTAGKAKTEAATLPKGTAAAKGRGAGRLAKASMATKVNWMPVKATATTTRTAPASGKTEGAKKTLAAQEPVRARVAANSSADPRKSTTNIVAASNPKTTDATTLPKGTAASVSGRATKNKSR